MAVDIRRMSKAELDELNRLGKEWRNRNKLVQEATAPATSPVVQLGPLRERGKMIDYYRDVRGLLCRRDGCNGEMERFGLCARHLKQIRDKKRRKLLLKGKE